MYLWSDFPQGEVVARHGIDVQGIKLLYESWDTLFEYPSRSSLCFLVAVDEVLVLHSPSREHVTAQWYFEENQWGETEWFVGGGGGEGKG